MIRRNREFQIFNLSFLDVISCGFGAVVLLVLISKTSVAPTVDTPQLGSLLQSLFHHETTISDLAAQLDRQRAELDRLKAENQKLANQRTIVTREVEAAAAQLAKVEADTAGLELVQSSLKTASIAKATATERDVEVGGIPVDSDYVVFIIDTSGSMLRIWDRVIKTIGHVLDIHPTVRGFQVLNDNGVYLLEAYRRRWIPDTARRRAKVLETLTAWRSASNSSPVEGLEVALKTYAKPNITTSIYVFGDDFTGSSFDAVIKKVQSLNLNRVSGKPVVKVHGVGFRSTGTTNRYPILMRELAKRNGGTFLGLP